MPAKLFFLLPEYKDPGNTTRFFLESDNMMTDAEMTDYLRRLRAIVLYFRCEDVDLYYDIENYRAFQFPIEVLPDEYPNKKRYNLEFVERNMENWREETEQVNGDRFSYQGQTITDNTLCEIAKRLFNNRRELYVVVNHQALNTVTRDHDKLRVKCCGREKRFSVVKADVNLLLAWLRCKGVILRIYHPNTAKHGTNGSGGSQAKNASSLLCSNKKAKKMMGKAVRIGEHLYYFDADELLYIRFMSGQNYTFHPYHIQSAQHESINVPHQAKLALKTHLGDFRSRFE